MTVEGTNGSPAAIAGRWAANQRWRPRGIDSGAEWRQQLDPGTGQPFAEVLDLEPAQISAHLARIRADYVADQLPSRERRAELLLSLADLVAEAAADLGGVDALCTGKRLSDSTATAEGGARILRYYAGLLTEDPYSSEPQSGDPSVRQLVDRVPVGLVACILPWNFPLSQACARLAMLFAAGNAGVFKGSELAQPPLLALEQLVAEAGFPQWAFSVLTGGPEAGRTLVEADEVDAICFTGGVPTGVAVAQGAMRSLKRLVLELGGKTPFVVFADADLERALEVALSAAFNFQGQACNAGSLLLVEAPLFEDFVERFTSRAAQLRIGHQLDAETEIGPMISADQRERVASMVTEAVAAGACLHTGGEPVTGLEGFFYRPTVLSAVPASANAASEEVFGPAVVCAPFEREEEIVEQVNGSPYGLAATFWTEDAARVERLRRALRTGQVYVNTHGQIPPNVPWGGFRMSGLGRLYGSDGLFAFTEARSTYAIAPRA